MRTRVLNTGDRNGLQPFRSLSGDLAARDAQDLMIYPWFALGKSKRLVPIDFRANDLIIRVEGTVEHGIATIWDADVLIWAASQLVEARDAGLPTSRLLITTPYEVLTFIRRGTSVRDYDRLKAALDRLQSTTIATSLRRSSERRLHRFSWVSEWRLLTDQRGRPQGIELVLPDWLYSAVLNQKLILTIDREYFNLTGGIERWLYRLVRKHAGRQPTGWRFAFRELHVRSGSLASIAMFAYELRDIVRRQSLPGYHLAIERSARQDEVLLFRPAPKPSSVARLVADLTRSVTVGEKL